MGGAATGRGIGRGRKQKHSQILSLALSLVLFLLFNISVIRLRNKKDRHVVSAKSLYRRSGIATPIFSNAEQQDSQHFHRKAV